MRIKQLGDPSLRQRSTPITDKQIASDELIPILDEMKTILNGIKAISDENGNALSAPQVGHLIRMILLRIDGEFVPMINPEYSPVSDRTFAFEEECFSMYQLRGTVQRFEKISVSYLDEYGTHHSQILKGEMAGLIQHEVDHLNGVLFIDHLDASNEPRSIDYELRDQPERLSQVKRMFDYMVG